MTLERRSAVQPTATAVDVNRRYYDSFQPGRDDYWRLMAAPRHRARVLIRELSRLQPRAVVDLGCGNGVLLEEMRKHLPDVSLAGIDLSAEQIAENDRVAPWARWYTANLELPLQDAASTVRTPRAAFDVVVASEVIEHLDAPEALLTNAGLLVRPGGHLLLSTQSGPVRETESRVGHRRHFSAAQMSDLFRESGWQAVRIWNTGFPFHDLSKWYANLNPEASFKRFGQTRYSWRENLICAALRLAFRLNSSSRGAQLFALARRPCFESRSKPY